MPLIATIAQEIIGLYKTWERYKEDINSVTSGGNGAGSGSNSGAASAQAPSSPFEGSATSLKRTLSGAAVGTRSGNTSLAGTPPDGIGIAETPKEDDEESGKVVTPQFLTMLLMKMRENRLADMAHPESGRPVAVNRLLERTQAAG
jgi:cyclin-C